MPCAILTFIVESCCRSTDTRLLQKHCFHSGARLRRQWPHLPLSTIGKERHERKEKDRRVPLAHCDARLVRTAPCIRRLTSGNIASAKISSTFWLTPLPAGTVPLSHQTACSSCSGSQVLRSEEISVWLMAHNCPFTYVSYGTMNTTSIFAHMSPGS